MDWSKFKLGGISSITTTKPTISIPGWNNPEVLKSLGIAVAPQKEPFVPQRLISPIPGDHQLDNAWTTEPGSMFAGFGKYYESILSDQTKRRAQYGDPLPENELANTYNVPLDMRGDTYLMD